MKCKQDHPRFELRQPSPFPMMISIILRVTHGNVISFNCLYNMNVKINVERMLLKLVDKHFVMFEMLYWPPRTKIA